MPSWCSSIASLTRLFLTAGIENLWPARLSPFMQFTEKKLLSTSSSPGRAPALSKFLRIRSRIVSILSSFVTRMDYSGTSQPLLTEWATVCTRNLEVPFFGLAFTISPFSFLP